MERPRAVPNCDEVLKTAPASACVFSGKISEMMLSPTVKSRLALSEHSAWAWKAPLQ